MKILKNPVYLIIILAVIFLAGKAYWEFRADKPLRELPYYGPWQIDSTRASGKENQDTVRHKIADFTFIDQQGNKFSKQQLEGKIYVADYFFVTCQSICPIMTTQMGRIADAFSNDPEICLVSHTVNPENDSVNVLTDYAKAHHVKYGQWYLVTGKKQELYELARKSYMLDASEGDGGIDDFIHTQNFALVDKEKHIRGYYDGTDSVQVNQLISDIKLLKKSYKN